MDEILRLLLVQLRSMQLYYHNAHNLTKGKTFFSDHAAFNEFYSELDGQYDSVAERAVGLYNEPLDLSIILPAINMNLQIVLKDYKSTQDMHKGGVLLEDELLKICSLVEVNPRATDGTKNLVADIADKAETRLYKLNQRLKEDSPLVSPLLGGLTHAS